MADEFQTGLCSGSWWSTDAVEAEAVAASCEDSVTSVSGSTVSFHDLQRPSPPVPSAGGFLLDSPVSTGYGTSSPTLDWNQNFQGHDDERGGGSFHNVLQEDHLNSTKSYGLVPDNNISQGRIGDSSSTNLFQDVSQAFLADQQHLNTAKEYVAGSSAYAFPPNYVQVLPEAVDFRNVMGNAWSKPPQCFKLPMFEEKQQPAGGQLQFITSNHPFWNAPTVAAVGDVTNEFYGPSLDTKFVAQAFLGKSSTNNPNPSKPDNQGLREISSSVTRRASSEQSFKKPRVETPSPLPAFKVRKEKLGDRITALQQLVSPFGKTDTASVLYEAIEYIKFLHDQVNVLSTPYLKNAHQLQHPQNYEKTRDGEGTKKDLRSRGLCLVPISSTFAVANEPTDFWTPTFGGKIRGRLNSMATKEECKKVLHRQPIMWQLYKLPKS